MTFLFYFHLFYSQINYASSLKGSYILDNSNHIVRVSSILSQREDHFMLASCKETFIIIKLSNEIKIKTIEIQNQEWLSNFVKTIKVSITGDFIPLNVFHLKKTRKKIVLNIDAQEFTSIVKIEMNEFWGDHDFFAITAIKIFGVTLIDEFMEKNKKKPLKYSGNDTNDKICFLKKGKKKSQKRNYNLRLVMIILLTICILIILNILYKLVNIAM